MHTSISAFFTVLLLFQAVRAIVHHPVSKNKVSKHPVDLHRRACMGLPFDAVHIQRTCVVDAKTRASCAEIQRFFSNLNESYVAEQWDNLDSLIKKRLKQEAAIQHASAGSDLCVNVEISLIKPRCPKNFIFFEGNCYVATSRRTTFDVARKECAMIRGSLINDTNPELLELLNYLVEFYIHDSVFIGLNTIVGGKYQKPANFNVAADFRSGDLQYVPPTSSRRFVCVVSTDVFTVPLYKSIPLPTHPDEIAIHDADEPVYPNIPNFKKYLADLFVFQVYNDGKSSKRTFAYRIDLLEIPPENSTFVRSLGSLILPIQRGNKTDPPTKVENVCSELVLLYRGHTKRNNEEFFTIRPFLKSKLVDYTPIGYCSPYKGHCGTDVPIYNDPKLLNTNSNLVPRIICYGYRIERDLDAELELHKPFRYAQVAKRVEQIFVTYYPKYFNSHYHRFSSNDGHRSEQVFQLINPLQARELSYYCSEKLVPVYRVIDYVNDNTMLVTDKNQLDRYRKKRNQYGEEELLGYCSSEIDYCGSSLPIHHYIVYHEYSNHVDDVYLPTILKDKECVDCDRSIHQGVLCYGF